MSTTTIYYGAPPKGTQSVSESLRLRGINLLRSTPKKAVPVGIRLINSPNYDIYTENLATVLHAHHNNTPIPVDRNQPFQQLESKANLEFGTRMRVVWDFKDATPPPDQTALDGMRARYQVSELSIHGKPAFMADLNITQLVSLMKIPGINRQVPTVSNTMNIFAAQILVKLQRTARAFLQLHQYPLASGPNGEHAMYQSFFIQEWSNPTSVFLLIMTDWIRLLHKAASTPRSGR